MLSGYWSESGVTTLDDSDKLDFNCLMADALICAISSSGMNEGGVSKAEKE
jgi:hypothetical protein